MVKLSDCEYGLGRGLREAYPSTGAAFTVMPALRRLGQPLRQVQRREGDRLICDTYAGDELVAHQEVTVAQAQADIAKAEAECHAMAARVWAEPVVHRDVKPANPAPKAAPVDPYEVFAIRRLDNAGRPCGPSASLAEAVERARQRLDDTKSALAAAERDAANDRREIAELEAAIAEHGRKAGGA